MITEPKLSLPAGFVRDYVVTMRPYLLFVSGITGVAGLALASRPPAVGTALLGLVFFLSYGFGQALTDCFQLDTDSISAPYRPLVRGTIRRRDVLAVSLAGLLACGLVVVRYNPWNLPFVALTVAGLATYTHFKRRPWSGPFYNAGIVAVLLLIGYASGVGAAGAVEGRGPGSVVFVGTAVVVFFGYANFVLTGYYKDISADRASGYRTLPVVSGLRFSSTVSDSFALLSLLGVILAVRGALTTASTATLPIVSMALLAAGVGATALGQIRLHRVDHESVAYRAIQPVVHAYILLLAGIAALLRPSWAGGLVLFYGAFWITMRTRPEREQI